MTTTPNTPHSVNTMADAIAPPQSDDEYELMPNGTWRRRAMQDMSVFIPRVFGNSRDAIRELIRLRFDQEGLGIVGRVDFATMRDGASLAAFVHFLQWRDTPAVTAFQAHLRQCSAESLDPDAEKLSRVAPSRMPAYTEVEGIPMGIPGTYWLLLENKSKAAPALPVPPPAPEEDQAVDEEVSIGQLLDENSALQTAITDLQERVMLQSKQIRDLEEQKAAPITAMQRMEKYADEDARMWEQVFEALNMSKDAFPVDADMRARAVYLVQSQAERLEALQSVGDTEPNSDEQHANEVEAYRRQVSTANAMEASARAEAQALRERIHALLEVGCVQRLAKVLQARLDQMNTEIRQTPGAHNRAWEIAYGTLRSGLPDAVKTEIVRMEQEQQEPAAPTTPVATVREHMAPPPAPLKRAHTEPLRLSEDEAEELREAWKREGLEGPVGDDHDADMAAMSERTVRFADEVLVDPRGPSVSMR